MKKLVYIVLPLCLGLFAGCSDYLDVPPIATQTEENFFDTPSNAVLAINGIYDVIDMSEGPGPDGQWLMHNYEFMFGDILSDDAEKGSQEADLTEVQNLVEWHAIPTNTILEAVWIKGFDGIARANTALKYLETSELDGALKSRLQGEAYFLKGYFYFTLLRTFGGVPIFDKPVTPDQFGKVPRASLHETFNYAASQFKLAADRLPMRSEYATTDLGRATKGAAQGFLARLLTYQIGMDKDNGGSATYQMVYDLTNEIITSGEYSLVPNFATLTEFEGENCSESLFEIQHIEGSQAYSPQSTGSNISQFCANRADWGWGFHNPTQNLVDAFEANDPRLSCTIYGPSFNDGIVQGAKNEYKLSEQMTPYLNRKLALAKSEVPSIKSSTAQNLRLMRLAEIYFLHAEAAIQLGNLGEAEDIVEMIRARARKSTLARGTVEGVLSYPTTGWTGNLPPVAIAGKTPAEAIDILLKEKRTEMANEYLRFYDLVRTGKYLATLDTKVTTFKNNDGDLRYAAIDLRGNCVARSIDGANGVVVPLMPIPAAECSTWGLVQNKGY